MRCSISSNSYARKATKPVYLRSCWVTSTAHNMSLSVWFHKKKKFHVSYVFYKIFGDPHKDCWLFEIRTVLTWFWRLIQKSPFRTLVACGRSKRGLAPGAGGVATRDLTSLGRHGRRPRHRDGRSCQYRYRKVLERTSLPQVYD